MHADCVLILLIAVFTALLGEGLTYVLVYRSEQYQKLKAEMEKTTKKLERKKETVVESDKAKKRKIEREEEKLQATNRDLSMFKLKSMIAVGGTFTALLSTFSSLFEGRVVAKLPFIPVSFLQGLSHRNLAGEDITDCSFIFLYILCTMSIRQSLQKALGFAPSRAMSRQQSYSSIFMRPATSQFNYLR